MSATMLVREIEDLLGWIAGEANHAVDRAYEQELDEVYGEFEALVAAAGRRRAHDQKLHLTGGELGNPLGEV